MKHVFWITLLAALIIPAAANAQTAREEEPEIVIELHGEKSPSYPTLTIWDKTAPQLTRLLRGKNRTYALYSIENVSSKDGVVRAADGTEYAFVQYGSDGGNYRKFIFKAENPQTFVAAAATAADVLAVNKKYGVNLVITKDEFLALYPVQDTQTDATDEVNGVTYEIFRTAYTDANTKTPKTRWFAFENGKLAQTFESRTEVDQFTNRLTADNLKNQADQIEKQKAQLEEDRKKNQEEAKKLRQRKPPHKVLVSGGTLHDQMYMPRLVTPPAKNKKEQ